MRVGFMSCGNILAIAITLTSAAPVLAQPVTTIITHGFKFDVFGDPEKQSWMREMGTAIINNSSGGQGAVLFYTPATGVWTALPGYANLSQNEPIVLIFNWVDESDGIGIPGNNIGYAEAAADALYAAIRDPQGIPFDVLTGRTVHFIGHSRGASVNSETVRRLSNAGIPVDQVTSLDPHPVGPMTEDCNLNGTPPWGDLIPQKWYGTVWADNYWRADGPGGCGHDCDFDGMAITGIYNVNLYNALDEGGSNNADNCLPPFFCTQEHSAVHTWYHGTVATNATTDDDCSIDQSEWYDGAEPGCFSSTCSGYVHSAMRGGPRSPQAEGESPGSFPILYNGTFQIGYSGWIYHGGRGDGDVVAEGGTSNWYLRLDGNETLFTHNRFFLPIDAYEVRFKYRIFASSNTNKLLVRLLDANGDSYPFPLINLNSPSGTWIDQAFDLGSPIQANKSYRLEFVLIPNGGPLNAVVGIDNVEIPGAQPGGDISIGTVTWDDDPGDNDGVTECGENAELRVQLCSDETVNGVHATLSGGSGCVAITDPTVDYGTINGSECITVGDFTLQVIGCACSGSFQLHLEYQRNNVPYEQTFFLSHFFCATNACNPVPEVCTTTVVLTDDCNGDGVLNSGERADIRVQIKNVGDATAIDPDVWLGCIAGLDLDCGPTFSIRYPDLPPDASCHWPELSGAHWDLEVHPQIAGTFTADLYATWDGAGATFVIPNAVQFTVAPVGGMKVHPATHDFGVVSSSQDITVPVSIDNYGSGSLTVTSISSTCSSLTWNGLQPPFSIGPGSSVQGIAILDTQQLSCQQVSCALVVTTSNGCVDDRGEDDQMALTGLVCDAWPVFTIPDSNVSLGLDDVDVSGHTVVWRSNDGDIYGHDIALSTTFPVLIAPESQGGPRISGNLVAWEEFTAADGDRDVYARYLPDGPVFPVANGPMREDLVGVDGNRIAIRKVFYEFQEPAYGPDPGNLLIYDALTGQTTPITSFVHNGFTPMGSVSTSQNDFGGGLLAWFQITFVWDGDNWNLNDHRLRIYDCNQGNMVLEYPIGGVSGVSANDSAVVWGNSSGEYDQVWKWQPGQFPIQLTFDSIDHARPETGGGLVVFTHDVTSSPPLFFIGVDGGDHVLVTDPPSYIFERWRMDDNLLIFRTTGQLWYAFLNDSDVSVVPSTITVSADPVYTCKPFDATGSVTNVAPFATSETISVHLYDGHPDFGGVLLATQTIAGLPASGSGTVQFTGVQVSSPDLCVRLSVPLPDNPANNTACKTLELLSCGACCFANGMCQADMTASECTAQSGNFQGNGTSCDQPPCPILIGACCLSDETCMDNLSLSQCVDFSGQFLGYGTVCNPAACNQCDLIGDATCDGVVNVLDLLEVIGGWGPCAAKPASCPVDLNHDEVVNVLDLLIVIGNWTS